MKTRIKNTVFIVLLVLVITLMNKKGFVDLLLNFAVTLALFIIYYGTFAIYYLLEEHRKNKVDEKILKSIQENKNK